MTGVPLEPDRATAIMVQAAAGTGAAHAQGIVHRDIKPANILITGDGRAKLVDFGIASAEGVERLTMTGTTIGSPHYISPEQAQGHKATPRSDVYALGVVLYELLAGRRPFDADNVAAIAMSHVEKDPGLPGDHVSGLDRRLDDITAKALSKRPEERFADGAALAAALDTGEDARTRVIAAAPPPAAGDTMVLGASTAALAEEDDDERESRLKPVLVGLLIGLGLLALAFAALSVAFDGDEPEAGRAPDEAPVQTPETTAPAEDVVPPGAEEPVIE